jgi:hypothetical protein
MAGSTLGATPTPPIIPTVPDAEERLSGFLVEFGAKYGAGTPSCDDAADWMLSDRAMRAGVAA